MQNNQIENGQENIKKIIQGMKKTKDIIGGTMGSLGNNVLTLQTNGAGIVMNDGIKLIQKINLEDKYEQYGVNLIKEAAFKTELTAGDGTSTTTVLTHELTTRLNSLMLEEGISMLEHQDKVRTIIESICLQLKVYSRKIFVGDNKDITNLIKTVSSDNKLIINALNEVYGDKYKDEYVLGKVETGEYGYTIEKEKDFNILISIMPEIIKLMFATSNTHSGSKSAIICFDKGVKDPSHIDKTVADALNNNEIDTLLIASVDFPDNTLQYLYNICKTNNKKIIPIHMTKDTIEDLAAKCGTIPSSNSELYSDKVFEYGFCDEFIIEIVHGLGSNLALNLKIKGGAGEEKIQKEYIKTLKKKVSSVDSMQQTIIKKRIALFEKGTIIISLKIPNHDRIMEINERLRDTLNSIKHGLDTGISPGGMFTYRNIAELPISDENSTEGLLTRSIYGAMQATHRKLIKNATSSEIVFEKEELSLYNSKTRQKENINKTTVWDTTISQTSSLINSSEAALLLLSIGNSIVEVDNEKTN